MAVKPWRTDSFCRECQGTPGRTPAWARSGENPHGRRSSIFTASYQTVWASLVAQTVKNLPAMQETQVQSLGREDPLEKGMATHSSNEMSSNELWDVYSFGVTLGCLYLGAQGCVPCCWRICLVK